MVRCESAVETDLTRAELLHVDDWLGGRLVAAEDGLRGPATAGETAVVWRGLVTGAYFGRLSGDPGLALDVTVGLARGWQSVEVELSLADGVPRSEGTDLLLRLDERAGRVDVALVAGDAAFAVGTFDFAATQVTLRLRAANPVVEGCSDCAYGTRVVAEAESSENRAALEPLIVHDRPLPVFGAPPLRLRARLAGEKESVELRDLTISRPRRDLCTQPAPSVELDGWDEVHALTGTTAIPPVLCLSGYGTDPESGQGEVRVARGRFREQDRVANTLAVPRWAPGDVPDRDARVGVVGARGDAPGFVLVTQRESQDPADLRVSVSEDCGAFTPSSPLVLEGFDAALRQGFGPEDVVSVTPLGISSPVDEGVFLWLLRLGGREELVLTCRLDPDGKTCALRGDPVELNAERIAPPLVTAIPGGRVWALLEARSSDARGQLRLLKQDGSRVGIAMRDRGVILDGASQVGLFDRYIHQGVAWVYPNVVPDPGAADSQTRPGWIVYTAGEDAVSPRRVGMARLDLIVGALEP